MRTLQQSEADASYGAEAADASSQDRYLTTAYTAPEVPGQKTEITRKAASDVALFVNCRVKDDKRDIMNFYNEPTGEDNDGDTMPTCLWELQSDDDNETLLAFGEFCEPEVFELKHRPSKTITPAHKIFPKVNHIGAQNKSHKKSQNMMKQPAQSVSSTSVLQEKSRDPRRREYDIRRKNLGNLMKSRGNEPEAAAEEITRKAGHAHHSYNMGGWINYAKNIEAENVREMKRNDALEKIAEKVQRHGAG